MKGDRERMDGDSEEREGVHGWRQRRERGSAWMERERESINGDNEERERSVWMETAKRERKCMDGEREGEHKWRQ